MTEVFFKMMELSQAGFYCSQILLIIGLEAQGKDNPDVVRAMSGLIGGMGFCGKACGALTGGACLIGLYAGKGTVEEMEDSRLNDMVRELVEWFEQETLPQYGSINCHDILEDNPANRMSRCPQLVLQTLDKVRDILSANGYSL
ncbi:DVU_1555 family C-GCAxxG-C-C protein [Sporomusa sp.]|jgi:C_GCAxxG_C_C family probable redox protein|uniref:DVU_1555 family C-GCAxxG-C-C protein n=1 Tax=Sporomusa sp. TaxID=2078658 RepID=UPI002CF3F207|nr:DV_1555 family C-GCAxxG-C-C protein [Sporomusa sp.]MDF2874990.1 GCAxxG family protein [Sporomusa sp.]HWR09027.1 C-GCAxxG-C-C family protein [Sporomusa sp.]